MEHKEKEENSKVLTWNSHQWAKCSKCKGKCVNCKSVYWKRRLGDGLEQSVKVSPKASEPSCSVLLNSCPVEKILIIKQNRS